MKQRWGWSLWAVCGLLLAAAWAEPTAEVKKLCDDGLAAKREGRMADAAELARKAIAQDKDCLDAHWLLAWVLAHQRECAEAIKEFGEVLRLAKPDSTQATEAKAAIARLKDEEPAAEAPATPPATPAPETPAAPAAAAPAAEAPAPAAPPAWACKVLSLPHAASVERVAFVSGGHGIVTEDAAGAVRLWCAQKGIELSSERLAEANKGGGVDLSPCGKLVAQAAKDSGKVTVTPLEGGQPVFSAELAQKTLGVVRFSPNGAYLAVLVEGGEVQVLNIASKKAVRSLPLEAPEGTPATLSWITYNQGGNLLAVVQPKRVQIWDPATGVNVRTYSPADLPAEVNLRGAALQPGSSQLAVSGAKSPLLWDWAKKADALALPAPNPDAVDFTSCGRLVAYAAKSQLVLFDTKDKCRLADTKLGIDPIRCLKFTPCNKALAIGGTAEGKGVLEVWKLDDDGLRPLP